MTSQHIPGTHPWVAESQEKLRFGVMLGNRLIDWSQQRDFAQAADELGFDTGWVGDHPFLGSDCWAMLAAYATSTRRIRLVSISCAPLRGPRWLARLAADVDRISGGRLILGLGAGWAESEAAFFGHPLPPIRERLRFLEETIQEIRSIWADPPKLTITLEGNDFVTTFPVGSVQHPYIPLMVAGAGEKVILRQVADYADMCDIEVIKAPTPEDVRRKLAVVREHCERRGRSFDTVVRGFQDNLITIAETEQGVADNLDRLAHFRVFPGFAGCTPVDLIKRYRPLIDAGVNHLTIASHLADISTLRLLADRVMPELREYYAAKARQFASAGATT